MAFDEKTAERLATLLYGRKGITAKRMFGGVAFLKDEKMFVGLASDDLMVRVGPENYAEALTKPHARVMDFTGKPMRGYVFVSMEGIRTAKQLAEWVNLAYEFVQTVTQKPKRKRVKRVAKKFRIQP